MTFDEAIEYFERLKVYAKQFQAQYPEYEQFTPAVDLAISALKKQMPMEPTNLWDDNDYQKGSCAICGEIVFFDFECCAQCGQAIDWTKAIKGE